MRYTLDFRHDADVHTFTTKDQTGKIEIVVPLNGGSIYYNVTQYCMPEAKNLSHRDVITTYYDPTDQSDFGITLLRATEMYLSLEDE